VALEVLPLQLRSCKYEWHNFFGLQACLWLRCGKPTPWSSWSVPWEWDMLELTTQCFTSKHWRYFSTSNSMNQEFKEWLNTVVINFKFSDQTGHVLACFLAMPNKSARLSFLLSKKLHQSRLRKRIHHDSTCTKIFFCKKKQS
jgi:hypothetical protein